VVTCLLLLSSVRKLPVACRRAGIGVQHCAVSRQR